MWRPAWVGTAWLGMPRVKDGADGSAGAAELWAGLGVWMAGAGVALP